MPTLHGAIQSPFVRKVRVLLAEKGIEYDSVPVVPFGQGEEFKKISPLGKIPVWEDERITVPDSSVIGAYLEHTYPEPVLYPHDAVDYARALWLEEYCDTKLVETLATVFFQRFVRPNFFQQEPDEELIAKAIQEDAPPVFDYLAGELGDRDYLLGSRFTIADIAASSPFVNFRHGGEQLDAGRWPTLAAWLERVWGRPSYKAILDEEFGG